MFNIFGDTTTKALEAIYHEVQEAFADYYRQINKDDESDFTAHLVPSIGKLGFDVDFYGRGRFPPGAYHSEGHQDRSEEHTSELQSLMRSSYAVFCIKNKQNKK